VQSQHADTLLTCPHRHLHVKDKTHTLGDLQRGGLHDRLLGFWTASWRVPARGSRWTRLGVAQLGCPGLMHGARLSTHRCMAWWSGGGVDGGRLGRGKGGSWLVHRLNAAVKSVVNRVTLLSLRMRL
jgi:hypothetical protein